MEEDGLDQRDHVSAGVVTGTNTRHVDDLQDRRQEDFTTSTSPFHSFVVTLARSLPQTPSDGMNHRHPRRHARQIQSLFCSKHSEKLALSG